MPAADCGNCSAGGGGERGVSMCPAVHRSATLTPANLLGVAVAVLKRDGPVPRRGLTIVLALLTAQFVLVGVGAMLWLSPKVPYADPWRFLTTLSQLPFPASVFHVDNGHREVLPNLVKLAELRWFAASQWLQVLVGAAFALATFATLAHAVRDQYRDPVRYQALLCVFALALFWLGNERTLTHGNESLHAYLITWCLASGLGWLQRPGTRSVVPAAGLGLLATFSFGTGIACFAAFALALWLLRAQWRQWVILIGGAALSAGLYLLGASGVAGGVQWSPMAQVPHLLRWLAAPLIYAAWPLIDPDVAAQVPTHIGPALVEPVARHWLSVFGPVETARWPWLAIGGAGLVLFTWLLVKARQRHACPRAVIVGLGLAAFGLAVGAVIVAARADYFTRLHPDQLVATRYLVWSSLFWGGLAVAALGLATRQLRAVAIGAAVIAVLVLPSQLWMGRLAWTTRGTAEQVALGAAVGVLDSAQPLGETVFEELRRALPHLQRQQAAMYAWPEMRRLEQPAAASGVEIVAARDWQTQDIGNRFGTPGQQVAFVADADADRLLIVDGHGRARGLAMPDRRLGDNHWRGWVRGKATTEPWQAAQLRR